MISVDTKKKELVGAYKNGGTEWRPAGDPEQVKVHDFIDPALGKVNPYGVYDLGANTGWVRIASVRRTAAGSDAFVVFVTAAAFGSEAPIAAINAEMSASVVVSSHAIEMPVASRRRSS